MKKDNFLSIFFGIFTLIGIGLLIGSIVLFKNAADFKEIADEVTAEITRMEAYRNSDGDTSHDVFVTYTYNGQLYESVPINFYSSSMYEGKEISLLCDPEHPTRIRENSGIDFAGGILLFIGFIFSMIGIVPLVITIRSKCKAKDLLKNGRVLYATVEAIDYNMSYTVNGRHPFIIYCTYKDEYKDILYRFKSHNLWSDPSHVFPVGSDIEVFVDSNDYSRYYVKVEEVMSKRIVDYT